MYFKQSYAVSYTFSYWGKFHMLKLTILKLLKKISSFSISRTIISLSSQSHFIAPSRSPISGSIHSPPCTHSCNSQSAACLSESTIQLLNSSFKCMPFHGYATFCLSVHLLMDLGCICLLWIVVVLVTFLWIFYISIC